jgi:uncharacterized protein
MKGQILIESVVPILITMPFILIFIENKSGFKTLGFFVIIFIAHEVLVRLPMHYTQLKIVNGQWNWTGKLFGIIFSILVYIGIRKRISPYGFLKIKQRQQYFHKTIIATVLVTCTAFFSYFDRSMTIDTETLLYQLTMPGLDEEIMFRGILLGLLLTCLKDSIKVGQYNFGSPSVLIIGLIFGILHGLSFTNNFGFRFDYLYFLSTFLSGYIWGWTTLKSESILQSLVSHNVLNFVEHLIRMIK